MTDTATVTTYDETVTFRLTLDPSKAPDVIQDLIAHSGPEVTEFAARSSFEDMVTHFIEEMNAGGAGYLVLDRVVEEAVTE